MQSNFNQFTNQPLLATQFVPIHQYNALLEENQRLKQQVQMLFNFNQNLQSSNNMITQMLFRQSQQQVPQQEQVQPQVPQQVQPQVQPQVPQQVQPQVQQQVQPQVQTAIPILNPIAQVQQVVEVPVEPQVEPIDTSSETETDDELSSSTEIQLSKLKPFVPSERLQNLLDEMSDDELDGEIEVQPKITSSMFDKSLTELKSELFIKKSPIKIRPEKAEQRTVKMSKMMFVNDCYLIKIDQFFNRSKIVLNFLDIISTNDDSPYLINEVEIVKLKCSNNKPVWGLTYHGFLKLMHYLKNNADNKLVDKYLARFQNVLSITAHCVEII